MGNQYHRVFRFLNVESDPLRFGMQRPITIGEHGHGHGLMTAVTNSFTHIGPEGFIEGGTSHQKVGEHGYFPIVIWGIWWT
jgi:hypothetical protein